MIDHSNKAKNARVTARGDYTRWLAKRFGSIDLMMTKEGENRVSLSKIYIPTRLDTEDPDEKSIGTPDEVAEEQKLGWEAKEIIAEQPLTVISGRPGSGKSTLTQALIYELCNSNSKSHFQRDLIQSIQSTNKELDLHRADKVLPIPLILRSFQKELADINTFDDLITLWWQKAAEESHDKRYNNTAVNAEALMQSIHPEGDDIPMLVVFDGIDEVGGLVQREKIMALAEQALIQGNRVVVTGRPTGFSDLKHNAFAGRWEAWRQQLHHVQPFSWPEISTFIEQFYRVQDEWKHLRVQGIEQFNGALQDQQKSYLLNLARRPIFLTLMALVHINDTVMPYGRADLYQRIIDLYLIRQTQHKRLKESQAGRPIQIWDEREIRRALGYLAWRSQKRCNDEDTAPWEDEPDRRVLWTKQEMLAELTSLLGDSEQDFQHIQQKEAEDLLNYYLHPAGLLVEPAEGQIQFSHLSFQEYLCAEYLHGQCNRYGTRRFIKQVEKLLLDELENPGWDEIGLLFLTIHSSQGQQSQSTAHFEILAELDICKAAQAKLLLTAFCGQELRFTEHQREGWLPLVIMACLLHPESEIAEKLSELDTVSESLLSILLSCLTVDAFNIARHLQKYATNNLPEGFYDHEDIQNWFTKEVLSAWQEPHNSLSRAVPQVNDGLTPNLEDLYKDIQQRAIFLLIIFSGWFCDERESILTTHLSAWLKSNSIKVFRSKNNIPYIPGVISSISELAYGNITLSDIINSALPIDWWLMRGEYHDTEYYVTKWDEYIFQPKKPVCNKIKLFLNLYQINILSEYLNNQHYLVLVKKETVIDDSRSWSKSIPRWWLIPSSSLMSVSQSWSRSISRTIQLSTVQHSPSQSQNLFFLLIEYIGQFYSLSEVDEKNIMQVNQKQTHSESINKTLSSVCHFTAKNWFYEQSENQQLSTNRGILDQEIIPQSIGIFDAKGIPLNQQTRGSWIKLKDWLSDNDSILDFVFPEKLDDEEYYQFTAELDILREQPWSPMNIVDVTLSEWDKNQEIREIDSDKIAEDLLSEIKNYIDKNT